MSRELEKITEVLLQAQAQAQAASEDSRQAIDPIDVVASLLDVSYDGGPGNGQIEDLSAELRKLRYHVAAMYALLPVSVAAKLIYEGRYK